MTHIRTTSDPITLKDLDLHALASFPRLEDCKGEYCLTMHFENEKSRELFVRLEVDRGVSDLDNPCEEWLDEG